MLPVRSRFIEYRARRIDDPIARLKYLRSRGAAPRRRFHRLFAALPAGMLIVAAGLWSGVRHEPAAIDEPRLSVGPSRATPAPWLVELRNGQEIWSNGLRIDSGDAVRGNRRRYFIHQLSQLSSTVSHSPSGILFHSTEGDLVPLEPVRNNQIRLAGHALRTFLREHRSYHYLIDRFGGVIRIVEDDSAANHAGHAVWASHGIAVLNLNHAFLAVAFEGHTGQRLVAAQTHAALLLVEVLRSRYGIRAENCLTHAQVSVNPGNMLIGWHTDLGEGFPWTEIGLANNYSWPPAALAELGFDWDPNYLRQADERLWAGVRRAGVRAAENADRAGLSPQRWRKQRRDLYQQLRRKEQGTT